MREIKFRAWSTIGKRMYNWEEIISVSHYFLNYIKWHDMYHVMQYTGLKDTNGREIYEGDILSIWYPDVKSPKHINKVIYRDNAACFDTPFVEDWLRARTEILGNIFEHPELLQQEGEKKIGE